MTEPSKQAVSVSSPETLSTPDTRGNLDKLQSGIIQTAQQTVASLKPVVCMAVLGLTPIAPMPARASTVEASAKTEILKASDPRFAQVLQKIGFTTEQAKTVVAVSEENRQLIAEGKIPSDAIYLFDPEFVRGLRQMDSLVNTGHLIPNASVQELGLKSMEK